MCKPVIFSKTQKIHSQPERIYIINIDRHLTCKNFAKEFLEAHCIDGLDLLHTWLCHTTIGRVCLRFLITMTNLTQNDKKCQICKNWFLRFWHQKVPKTTRILCVLGIGPFKTQKLNFRKNRNKLILPKKWILRWIPHFLHSGAQNVFWGKWLWCLFLKGLVMPFLVILTTKCKIN